MIFDVNRQEIEKIRRTLLNYSPALLLPFFIPQLSITIKLVLDLIMILIVLISLKIRFQQLGEEGFGSSAQLIHKLYSCLLPKQFLANAKSESKFDPPKAKSRVEDFLGFKNTFKPPVLEDIDDDNTSAITFDDRKNGHFSIESRGRRGEFEGRKQVVKLNLKNYRDNKEAEKFSLANYQSGLVSIQKSLLEMRPNIQNLSYSYQKVERFDRLGRSDSTASFGSGYQGLDVEFSLSKPQNPQKYHLIIFHFFDLIHMT